MTPYLGSSETDTNDRDETRRDETGRDETRRGGRTDRQDKTTGQARTKPNDRRRGRKRGDGTSEDIAGRGSMTDRAQHTTRRVSTQQDGAARLIEHSTRRDESGNVRKRQYGARHD